MSLRLSEIVATAARPAVGQISRYDASAGALVVLLPALEDSAVGAPMMLQKVDASVNMVSFTLVDGDVFDDDTTSLSLGAAGSAYVLQVVSLSGVKYWKVMGVLPGVNFSATLLSGGGGQYWPELLEISQGAAYEIGAGSVMEIG